MKLISLFTFSFFISTSIIAQSPISSKYATIITAENLKKHLTIIAGDEMEGRETGTEGQRKAAAYIEAYFKKIGTKPIPALKGYQQFYPLYRDSTTTAQLNLKQIELQYGADFIIPANNNENGQFKSNAIVFAGYGIDDSTYNDYKNLDVKGKVVVFILGEPKKEGKYFISGTGRSSEWTAFGITKKLAAAEKNGAIGALIINPTQINFQEKAIENSKKTNQYFPRTDNNNPTLNYALITHAVAGKILTNSADSVIKWAKENKPFNDNERSTLSTAINFNFNKYRHVTKASNVAAIIEGSDKKSEYVFLTAHYDHLGKRDGKIYYGADDDGSGTVAVLEMAAAFAKAKAAGKGPRRTVVCMTVSGEEKGLWGSEYYSDHPFFPLEKTSVDLNTDMIGRIDTERTTADSLNYVYVVGHDKISSELPLINEAVNNKFTQLVLDYKFDDPADPNRIYYRSDHYNFARKGVPVLFFYDGMLKADYHKTTDTVDKIYWNLFEKRARMIFLTAWEMANRNDMLIRDKPLPTGTR
jgi:hypothetical protein